MKAGDAVRILINAGGCQRGTASHATRFAGKVKAGAIGTYIGPLSGQLGAEDLHAIACGELDYPLHSSQFEVVDDQPVRP